MAEPQSAPARPNETVDEPPRPTEVREWFGVAQWAAMTTDQREAIVYAAGQTYRRYHSEIVRLRKELEKEQKQNAILAHALDGWDHLKMDALNAALASAKASQRALEQRVKELEGEISHLRGPRDITNTLRTSNA
jgi:predicted  nucleic acid-binding Zn-ribbon protein